MTESRERKTLFFNLNASDSDPLLSAQSCVSLVENHCFSIFSLDWEGYLHGKTERNEAAGIVLAGISTETCCLTPIQEPNLQSPSSKKSQPALELPTTECSNYCLPLAPVADARSWYLWQVTVRTEYIQWRAYSPEVNLRELGWVCLATFWERWNLCFGYFTGKVGGKAPTPFG